MERGGYPAASPSSGSTEREAPGSSTTVMRFPAMVRAAKPGGRVVVLDYNHTRTSHTPEPPPTMQAFHAAFLRWRAEAGLDNAITDHLAGMFASAGLRDVVEIPQLEVTQRGDPDFHVRAGIWAETAAFHGLRMVEDGVLTEQERAATEADYRQWVATQAQSQTLYLVSVEGLRPPRLSAQEFRRQS
jgi:hypothetical protein